MPKLALFGRYNYVVLTYLELTCQPSCHCSYRSKSTFKVKLTSVLLASNSHKKRIFYLQGRTNSTRASQEALNHFSGSFMLAKGLGLQSLLGWPLQLLCKLCIMIGALDSSLQHFQPFSRKIWAENQSRQSGKVEEKT